MTVVRMKPGVLDRVQATVTPTLQRAVARLGDELRLPVEYHFGWRDTDGRPCAARAGKGVRAGLALLSAEAAGAPGDTALPAAAAVELVHAFSLLHDDIVDDDHQRHHRATVWSVFGVGVGIIAGDALLALAEELLLEGARPEGALAAVRLTEATRAMIAGQAADMAFERRTDVTLEECVAMAEAKTGALLACAASIGAVLAGAGDAVTEPLRRFGEELGLAFQATDDLLGIWGDPERTGKPVWSDLRQGKKTLPITAALSLGGASAAELRSLLLTGLGTETDFARAAALIEACGGREATAELAAGCSDRAHAALDELPVTGDGALAVSELRDLTDFLLERDH
ncbi:MAG TPA: polyprenyl synthetase family protein [Acidimicrobiia bacterium]|nr:polyprenyl synthetase family protein [Acidimicrobiia bacterium]